MGPESSAGGFLHPEIPEALWHTSSFIVDDLKHLTHIRGLTVWAALCSLHCFPGWGLPQQLQPFHGIKHR